MTVFVGTAATLHWQSKDIPTWQPVPNITDLVQHRVHHSTVLPFDLYTWRACTQDCIDTPCLGYILANGNGKDGGQDCIIFVEREGIARPRIDPGNVTAVPKRPEKLQSRKSGHPFITLAMTYVLSLGIAIFAAQVLLRTTSHLNLQPAWIFNPTNDDVKAAWVTALWALNIACVVWMNETRDRTKRSYPIAEVLGRGWILGWCVVGTAAFSVVGWRVWREIDKEENGSDGKEGRVDVGEGDGDATKVDIGEDEGEGVLVEREGDMEGFRGRGQ